MESYDRIRLTGRLAQRSSENWSGAQMYNSSTITHGYGTIEDDLSITIIFPMKLLGLVIT